GKRAIAHILRRKREALGLSATQVARRANLDPGTVTRIELGQINEPTPASLKAIAGVLDIPVSDLFVVADWIPQAELPSLLPYLRSKYADLPQQAIDELEALIARLRPDRPHHAEVNPELSNRNA
ncbi:MAG: helix-turn-helix domain-containing protein, partial [Actinomycetia bacterium]|nr:helix-turn-helix domain-containing protein [Actinomycetes bacterium]